MSQICFFASRHCSVLPLSLARSDGESPRRSARPNPYLVRAVFLQDVTLVNSGVHRGHCLSTQKRGGGLHQRPSPRRPDDDRETARAPEGRSTFVHSDGPFHAVTICTYLGINLFGRDVSPSVSHSASGLGRSRTRARQWERNQTPGCLLAFFSSDKGPRRPFSEPRTLFSVAAKRRPTFDLN